MRTHLLSFNSFNHLQNVLMLKILKPRYDWKRRKKERNVSGDKTIFLGITSQHTFDDNLFERALSLNLTLSHYIHTPQKIQRENERRRSKQTQVGKRGMEVGWEKER